ncbi:MAG: hypothetical protein PHN82_09725 [bacterium]|nr:hypothetical protein [bacterium]
MTDGEVAGGGAVIDDADLLFLEKLCRGETADRRPFWEEYFAAVRGAAKAELHCHLAGSMRPETFRELARSIPDLDWSFCDAGFGYGVGPAVAGGTLEDAKRLLEYRKAGGSLSDYMLSYALPKTVLANEAALRRVIFEVCEDNHREGVRYLEIRFNPHMLTGGIRTAAYIEALAEGAERAERELPGFEAVLILSLVKDYEPEVVERLLDEVIEANGRAGVRGRVRGIDSAGNELGFAIEGHANVFARARAAGFAVVCHAGEAFACLEDGIGMIEGAVQILGARRIGHGLAAGIDPARLAGSEDMRGRPYDARRIEALAARQAALRGRLARERIAIEVCPSSNLHTGNVRSLAEHPLAVFLAEGLPVAVCTDNRWISHTKLTWEIVRMAKWLDLPIETARALADAAFSFRLDDIAGEDGC